MVLNEVKQSHNIHQTNAYENNSSKSGLSAYLANICGTHLLWLVSSM